MLKVGINVTISNGSVYAYFFANMLFHYLLVFSGHFSTISTWHLGWSSSMVCWICWVVHSVWYLVLQTILFPLWHCFLIWGLVNLGLGLMSKAMLFSFSDWYFELKGDFALSTIPSGQIRTRTCKIWEIFAIPHKEFWSKWTFKQGLRKVKKLLKQIFTKYVSFLLHLRFSSTQQVWKNFLLAVTPSPKFFWIYKTLFQQSKSHLGNIKNLTNSLIHNSWSRTTWLAINFAIKMSGDGRKFNFHYIPHFFCKA